MFVIHFLPVTSPT